MESGQANGSRLDLVLLLLALALFLFVSPFTAWWAGAGLPWYLPFVLWGILIAAVALHHWLERGHGT
ncbi:MAG: hypothetical protein U5K43_09500 [Halofilum sp. (in: g-proteobacteria)]|nr:hypothetical protein [Halofilum sp. (in: g-proteobacteria)]